MFDSPTPALQQAEDAMGAVDVDVLVGTQPGELVDRLIRHERATAALKLKAIARAQAMNQWQREGYRTYEDWLAAKSGTSKSQARRQAKAAKNMGDQPDVADALASGEISEDQAELVADAAEKNPAARKKLLDTAKSKGRSHRDLCDEAGKAKAAAETERARRKRLRDGQQASWGGDRDGFFALRGQHDPEIGAAVGATSTPKSTASSANPAKKATGSPSPASAPTPSPPSSWVATPTPDSQPSPAQQTTPTTPPRRTRHAHQPPREALAPPAPPRNSPRHRQTYTSPTPATPPTPSRDR